MYRSLHHKESCSTDCGHWQVNLFRAPLCIDKNIDIWRQWQYDILPPLAIWCIALSISCPTPFMVILNLLCRIICCCLQPFIIHFNVILTIIHHTDNGQKPQTPITSSCKNSLLNRFTFCSHISACECKSSSMMLDEFALDDAALKGQRRAELGI